MSNQPSKSKHHHHRHPPAADDIFLEKVLTPSTPPAVTADCYRIAGYVDGLVGAAKPDCNLLRPHFDSGLKWADKNNPRPDDPL
jgi:hypothetical protein